MGAGWVIRTSGEQRIRNFPLWQSAYSELVSLDKLWPGFVKEDLVEAIRFIKQSYDLEGIRVLSYGRLRDLAVLVNAVAFFSAVVLGTRIKLDILATPLIEAAKRLFGISDFRLYALADGIREVCARSPRRSQPGAKDPPQLTLRFG